MARRRDAEGAARCGQQAANAMRMATQDTLIKPGVEPVGTRGTERIDDWWYHEEQAVRMARLACHYAFKKNPKLKPMDSYETAVAQHKEMTR